MKKQKNGQKNKHGIPQKAPITITLSNIAKITALVFEKKIGNAKNTTNRSKNANVYSEV